MFLLVEGLFILAFSRVCHSSHLTIISCDQINKRRTINILYSEYYLLYRGSIVQSSYRICCAGSFPSQKSVDKGGIASFIQSTSPMISPDPDYSTAVLEISISWHWTRGKVILYKILLMVFYVFKNRIPPYCIDFPFREYNSILFVSFSFFDGRTGLESWGSFNYFNFNCLFTSI